MSDKKTKRGRPPGDVLKRYQVWTRLNKAELKAFRRACDILGKSPAEVLRIAAGKVASGAIVLGE